MNWFVRTLFGAFVAGVGWKLGADSYEAVKKRLKQRRGETSTDGADNGAGPAQTRAVEISHDDPEPEE